MANSARIDPNQLSFAIKEALDGYSLEVAEQVKQASYDAADYCVSQIKQNGAGLFGGSGDYINSWTSDKVYESKYQVKYVVHCQAPHYRLAHLLEYNHPHWVWGKTLMTYRGRPHIRPAEKATQKKFESEITARLKKK